MDIYLWKIFHRYIPVFFVFYNLIKNLMSNIKKYLIGFIIWLSLIISIWYAAWPNYGSIGALFNITPSWVVLGMSWSSLMNNSVWTEKLSFPVPTSVAEMTDSWSYYTKSEADSLFTGNNCILNWKKVLNWSWITAYYSLTVPYWSTCSQQTRTCTNWNLSWEYNFLSCSVKSLANANDCSTIWWYCKWWKYAWNNIVVQTSDLSDYDWPNAVVACENSTAWWKSDWVLPTLVQLSNLYTNKYNIWGFITNSTASAVFNPNLYWSITEKHYSSIDYAWGITFDNGNQDYYVESGSMFGNEYNVRCIRTL